VYLLDGTRLGLLKNIRKLEHTRVKTKTGGRRRNSSSSSWAYRTGNPRVHLPEDSSL